MIEWKDIDGYDGSYQVSNTGEVKSVERMVNKHVVKEKIMAKISGSDNEHEYVSLSDGHGNRKKSYVYLLVAKAFVPNPSNFTNVREKDGNIQNTNADNLEWYNPITKKERSRMYYRKRDKSKCASCGSKLDRDGCYCQSCIEKRREEGKVSRIFYQSIGICPECKKNKIMGDEKSCPECRAKDAEYKVNERRKKRDKINDIQRRCRIRTYNRLIEYGLCTRCGGTRDDKRYKMCSRCRAKKNEQRKRRRTTGERERRVQSGLCFFCGQPALNGYKTCEKHYKMCVDNANKSNRTYWKSLNSETFKN